MNNYPLLPKHRDVKPKRLKHGTARRNNKAKVRRELGRIKRDANPPPPQVLTPSAQAGKSLRDKINEASSPDQVTALLSKAQKGKFMSVRTWKRLITTAANRMNYFEEKRRKDLENARKIVKTAQQRITG